MFDNQVREELIAAQVLMTCGRQRRAVTMCYAAGVHLCTVLSSAVHAPATHLNVVTALHLEIMTRHLPCNTRLYPQTQHLHHIETHAQMPIYDTQGPLTLLINILELEISSLYHIVICPSFS